MLQLSDRARRRAWPPHRAAIAMPWSACVLATCLLSACGGGGGGSSGGATQTTPAAVVPGASAPDGAASTPAPMSSVNAVRLAGQATFGQTEALLVDIKAQGAEAWVANQLGLSGSRYSAGGSADIHRNATAVAYCDQPAHSGTNCWRDNYSTQPLVWDFYRNAVAQPDQLRQRVAFALQQILVVSNVETEGTYGFREYQNTLLDNAFGNYRQLLRKVAVSPLMGDYLNNANNAQSAPNENFARELLQLFSIGTCELNADGTQKGSSCAATYDNDKVRAYAYALTGWTFPAGGSAADGCWPAGANCRFYSGDMIPLASFHDTAARTLLSGVNVTAGTDAPAALERVLDSLMAHPNIAPFIGKRLIQHLVMSNPTSGYVQRVATAFKTGRYQGATQSFGNGQAGDMAATVAAVLLDAEARTDTTVRSAGKPREPVLMFTGVLRALNGKTDGDSLGWWIGGDLRQIVFRPLTVFSFYPPDYPVAGTALVAPAFAIHSANTALARMNFLFYMLDIGGSGADASVPNAVGTKVDLSGFESDAGDPAVLVDRMSALAFGGVLAAPARDKVIAAVSWWTADTDAVNWKNYRVRTAAYLVFASPNYQVQR